MTTADYYGRLRKHAHMPAMIAHVGAVLISQNLWMLASLVLFNLVLYIGVGKAIAQSEKHGVRKMATGVFLIAISILIMITIQVGSATSLYGAPGFLISFLTSIWFGPLMIWLVYMERHISEKPENQFGERVLFFVFGISGLIWLALAFKPFINSIDFLLKTATR